MKKWLGSESALKVFSVLIAISLWFYVAQVEKPDISRTIKDVPVVFTQTDLLEQKKLTLLNDMEYTIDVEVRGARNYVMDVNRENLTVLADLGSISQTGRHTVYPNIVLPYANLELLNSNPSALNIDIDALVSETKPVRIVAEGSPKDSYMVGKMTTNVSSMTVKGPKTIIDGIEAVGVLVNTAGKSADIAATEPVVAIGTGGKEIKNSLLSYSVPTLEISVEILKTKTCELEIVYSDYAETLQNDYVLDKGSIREVKVAGSASLLQSMDTVKTQPVSTYNLNENGEITVKLDLPQGVRSLGGDSVTLRYSKKVAE